MIGKPDRRGRAEGNAFLPSFRKTMTTTQEVFQVVLSLSPEPLIRKLERMLEYEEYHTHKFPDFLFYTPYSTASTSMSAHAHI